MAGARFDILFAGELLADADPDRVSRWLQQRFKLSQKAAAKLFDGRSHTIKRDVGTATASRFREIFRDAGALIEIRPVAAPSDSPPSSTPDLPNTTELPGTSDFSTASEAIEPKPKARPATDSARPQEAEQKDEVPKYPPLDDLPEIDTSNLSLVPGQDWTLEDCQPPLPPIRLPDTSHLTLVLPEPSKVDEPED